ncbi:IucA/IucC family protein [Pseudoduganella ginsengisoli]|uniref:IucA/IucC family siderophore biosynthesis protein n=1 Tax=Pseudoduganella ginsengisoli TaxID=1462440 RepID=A0A6L6PUU9_9BURK|nr:IucA/IucC family protein [Pseudoduganella ginsengisoli]MTW00768.1 IucA/IucC family siderophore biosynthesis protein [Pseudoduganella ginsengisoli]
MRDNSDTLPSWMALTDAIASPSYQTAQRRVLRQLIEALLFERVLNVRTTVNGPDDVTFDIDAQTSAGQPVTFRCHGYISDSFERIRLDDTPLLRISAEGMRPAASVQEFVLETGPVIHADEPLLARFLHELQQTLLKDTVSLHLRQIRHGERDLTALEGQLQDGHPYHPCYKSRVGFDPLDNLAYGPEFAPAVRLIWLAIRKPLASLAACSDIDAAAFVRAELGEVRHARFMAALHERGLDPHDYYLLPAHPWQWREKIAAELFPLLHSRDLVLLGEGDDRYRPLQSIRSLANASRPKGAHVKLPISIVNTSADRILSCHNVENAPLVSDWLCGILADDAALRGYGLVFLREVVGITYRPPGLPLSMQARQYGMLGAVWRESVDMHLHAGEAAAPFSGLCQCEADGQPFIAPWVARHGLTAWLDALFEASIAPLVHLLYAHGIGMEAHAQNIVLIHRAGLPQRIALKDLPGGLRFLPSCLQHPGRCPPLAPTPSFRKQVNATAGMEAATPEQVRDYFHDAVFFINFGELSLFLRRHYGLMEADFWARIAACIHRYQARHPELAERFAAMDLFAPAIVVEQLAKRRLFAETEARLQTVANPLHRHRSAMAVHCAGTPAR